MPAQQRGLGKGLDALLKGVQKEEAQESEINTLPIDVIEPNPHQPRKEFSQESLRELADSIRSQGVLQPILVRSAPGKEGRFQIVAGERRWRATKLAQLDRIPVLLRELSDEESLAIALIENLQREDLNPIEEALGIRQLQKQFGLNQESLATRIGKSRSAVANTLRLLQLPDSIQGDIQNNALSAGHARALLAISDPEAQTILRDRILSGNLSVREVESQANYYREHGALPSEEVETEPVHEYKRSSNRGKSRDADPEMIEIGKRLGDALGMKVSIQGALDKGRIVISYASNAQLQDMLDRFDAGDVG